MPNSPNSQFIETDDTLSIGDVPSGISGVLTVTKRGPIGDAGQLITSWPQFVSIYGGLIQGIDGPLLCKRALERGSALRVSRIGHYTNIADINTLDAEFASIGIMTQSSLNAPLAAGQTATYTVPGYAPVSTAFSMSSYQTLSNLVALINKIAGVAKATVINGTTIGVTLKDGTTAGALTLAGANAPTVTGTDVTAITDADGNVLFHVAPKYPGADYNNVLMEIIPSGNTALGYFGIAITHLVDGIREKYDNLRIIGRPTVAQSNFAKDVNAQSNLIKITYTDLSAVAGNNALIPNAGVFNFRGGSDGGALTPNDYIGDVNANTGIYTFNGSDDINQMAILEDSLDPSVIVALGAYVKTRTDLNGFVHFPGTNESDIVAFRDSLNIDNNYLRFYAGGVQVYDTLLSDTRVISELGDVLGIAAYSQNKYAPYVSFAGPNRGLITNALGSGNQWGAKGNKAKLDLLAQHQVNVVINRSGKTLLWGNFTAQLDNSQLSFGNVRDLNIYLRKALGPIIEKYIEEPCEPGTWKKLYLEVKPWLDALIPAKAFFSYRWEGDQFAKDVSDDSLTVNKAADVAQGKYKAKLFTKDIVAMQEVAIDVTITGSEVSFEESLTL